MIIVLKVISIEIGQNNDGLAIALKYFMDNWSLTTPCFSMIFCGTDNHRGCTENHRGCTENQRGRTESHEKS